MRAFGTMLRIGFAELAAYRGEVVIWILTTTMPLIMFALWSTLAREAPVGRYDEATFAAYFLSTLVVRQLASAWVVWELNYTIRTGALSGLLLRPVHPLWYFAAQNLGVVPFRALILTPLVVVAYLVFDGLPYTLSPLNVALYVWTIAWAWLLTFLVQAMFGLLALYTQQSLSFQEAWFGLWALLSGYLLPLELADALEAVAVWLPFRAMGSLPTEIIIGHLEGPALLQGVLTQLGWAAVVLAAVAFTWRRAVVRYEAFGG